MPHRKYAKNRREYTKGELIDAILKLTVIGMEAKVENVVDVVRISKQAAYKRLRKMAKE